MYVSYKVLTITVKCTASTDFYFKNPSDNETYRNSSVWSRTVPLRSHGPTDMKSLTAAFRNCSAKAPRRVATRTNKAHAHFRLASVVRNRQLWLAAVRMVINLRLP